MLYLPCCFYHTCIVLWWGIIYISLIIVKHDTDNKENLQENGNNADNNNNNNNQENTTKDNTSNNNNNNTTTDSNNNSDDDTNDTEETLLKESAEVEAGIAGLAIAEPSNFSVKHPLQNSWTIWYPSCLVLLFLSSFFFKHPCTWWVFHLFFFSYITLIISLLSQLFILLFINILLTHAPRYINLLLFMLKRLSCSFYLLKNWLLMILFDEWRYDNPGKRSNQASWGDHLKKITTFSFVEDFWRYIIYLHPHPDNLVMVVLILL